MDMVHGAPVATVDELVEQIKAGPSGPKVAAFFDFDGTLIQGYSAGALLAHRARNFQLGADEIFGTLRAATGGPLDEAAFENLLLQGIRGWVGRSEEELDELELLELEEPFEDFEEVLEDLLPPISTDSIFGAWFNL